MDEFDEEDAQLFPRVLDEKRLRKERLALPVFRPNDHHADLRDLFVPETHCQQLQTVQNVASARSVDYNVRLLRVSSHI
jgi:hypothetical protein